MSLHSFAELLGHLFCFVFVLHIHALPFFTDELQCLFQPIPSPRCINIVGRFYSFQKQQRYMQQCPQGQQGGPRREHETLI